MDMMKKETERSADAADVVGDQLGASSSRHVADEYAKTSDELLDYVAFLENELESLKLRSSMSESEHLQEKQRLKETLMLAMDQMQQAQSELDTHKQNMQQQDDSQSTLQLLKDDFKHTQQLLQEERCREKVLALEDRVQELELELEMKNDLISHRRKRDERARRQLEKENECLKKKATLGWMLGCLSEVYLQSDCEGNAAPLMRMVRKIQRELERENVVLSYSNEPPQIQLEYVEKEIRRLIDCARLSSDTETEIANSNKPPLPSQGSIEDGSNSAKDKENEGFQLSKVILYKPTSCSTFSVSDIASDLRGNQAMMPSTTAAPGAGPPDDRISEAGAGSPSARYIINCFNNGTNGRPETYRHQEAATLQPHEQQQKLDCPKASSSMPYPMSISQIEMFEANPRANVEHTRLSGSTWAEVKVLKQEEAERAEMLNCQSDIKRMLCSLEASMEYLLRLQQQQDHQCNSNTNTTTNNSNDNSSSNNKLMPSAPPSSTMTRALKFHSPSKSPATGSTRSIGSSVVKSTKSKSRKS